ncbi:MAG: hypothetical protein M3R07_06005 [Gemmatimonadota bacterium]|nr:hypothetical protein [Gemmatimonadota bacterium]
MERIKMGAAGGLAGGVVFGIMMAMMGMLPMIAGMVGSSSAAVGFLIHMMISALIGAGFGIVAGGRATSPGSAAAAGGLYGAFWWVAGPLTMMPLMMGMGFGSQWNAEAIRGALPSLVGHIIYGVILGFTYFRLSRGSRGIATA